MMEGISSAKIERAVYQMLEACKPGRPETALLLRLSRILVEAGASARMVRCPREPSKVDDDHQWGARCIGKGHTNDTSACHRAVVTCTSLSYPFDPV